VIIGPCSILHPVGQREKTLIQYSSNLNLHTAIIKVDCLSLYALYGHPNRYHWMKKDTLQ